MPNTSQPVVPSRVPSQIADENGRPTVEFVKWIQNVATAINAALSQSGQVIGYIAPTAHISGRTTSLGTVLQGLSDSGAVGIGALPIASAASPGIVQMPTGATGNTLGSAAIADSASFDAAGSAATAQTNAIAHADAAAAAAQSGAIAVATNASNINTGQLPTAQLPSNTAVVSTGTGAPGGTSTPGYQYYDTSVTPAHGYVYTPLGWKQFS